MASKVLSIFMKRTILFAILCAGLIFSSLGLDPKAKAQNKPKRGEQVATKTDTSKPPITDTTLSDIQSMVRARKAGKFAPNDPCVTADPITMGQAVNGTLANGDCIRTNGSAIDFYDFQGTSGQAIFVSMNSNAFDTFLFLIDDLGNIIDYNDDSGSTTDSRIPIGGGVMTLPYTGDFIIGASSYGPSIGPYTLTVDTDARCTIAPVTYNQTVSGGLANSDCPININDQPFWTDLYTFNGITGQQVSISMSSTAVDSYLFLHSPSGDGDLQDDDSGGGNNARIPAISTFALPETGIYTIEASSSGPAEVGSYTLSLVGPTSTPVSVGGRVVTPDGRGLRNATVSITDSLSSRRTATTSSFGFFTFDNILTGGTYTIRISSRLYRYTPQTLGIVDNVTLPDFVGLE